PELIPVLDVPGRVALAPELGARARPVHHPSLRERPRERLTVGPREHQDLARVGVLRDHRHEAAFVEGDLGDAEDLLRRHRRTGIPSSARCCLTCPIVSSASWKRLAARTASAMARPSAKWWSSPAPPDAISGTVVAS